MLRSSFLYLSRQARLRRWAETAALARSMSRRFVAGETLAEALDAARRVAAQGLVVTLDHLGENVTDEFEARADAAEAGQALRELAAAGLEPNVSIKLTQFGLDLGEAVCRQNVCQLAGQAAEIGGFVRIDMESSAYTDRTLAIVSDLYRSHHTVGAVIQAYLRRSERDTERLSEEGIRIRLCKGAYLESPSVAFEKKAEVDESFLRLMRYLLVHGTYPAIATHDERMIAATREFASREGIAPNRFEFQMLYGIQRELQRQLVADGYRVRLYVPYGVAWYPYFMRRLAERPANLLFLARSVLK